MVWLADHVVELKVLEELEDPRDALAAELLERLELLLELLEAGCAHRGLVEALDAHLLALPAVRQLDNALAAAPELLQHLVASLLQRLRGHVDRGVVESKLLAVLPEVELDKLVDLVHLQHAIAVKVEADVGADKVAERLRRNSDDLREDGPELLQAVEADAVGAAGNLLEALHHGLLELVSVAQQICYHPDACTCLWTR
eukprot:CAMPEP_0171242526 /NCGR_PEP_ID=MMETSP0790-20130122/45749_1 /TAXON_ID=2925 /ORGANISM="Alexandrium catenella, Strain OF101" /LENGTH=199 /DNA_ID=CAMNT_0011709355 /DNA_START=21 /DNA_END=617 /DNA_ORIENTATION=+